LAPQMVLRAYEMVRSVYEMVPRAYERVPRAYEKARLAPQMGHLVYGKVLRAYGMVPRDHERVLRGRQHGIVLHRRAVLSVLRCSTPAAPAAPRTSGRSWHLRRGDPPHSSNSRSWHLRRVALIRTSGRSWHLHQGVGPRSSGKAALLGYALGSMPCPLLLLMPFAPTIYPRGSMLTRLPGAARALC
jgi:hypothetical protein